MFNFNKNYRQRTVLNILILIIITVFMWNTTTIAHCVVEAKTKKRVEGTDCNGIKWRYNKKTKTLTFQGKGEMEEIPFDGHSSEPDWYVWSDDTEHIVIKEGITNVASFAFLDFMQVKDVYLSDSIKHIDAYAFDTCMSMTKIHMTKNVNKIDDGAFYGCKKLKQITIPKKVKYIGEYAYAYCESVSEITVPESVEFIGSGAFCGCKRLKSIKLPENLKTIHSNLFFECKKLKSITIPQSVKTICDGAFCKSGLEAIVIPKNVTNLKYEGWEHGVFENCPNLTKITIKSKKLKKCYKIAFYFIRYDAEITVPKGKKKEYKKLFYASGLDEDVKIKESK